MKLTVQKIMGEAAKTSHVYFCFHYILAPEHEILNFVGVYPIIYNEFVGVDIWFCYLPPQGYLIKMKLGL